MRYKVESYKYVNGVRVAVYTPQLSPCRQYIQRSKYNTRCYLSKSEKLGVVNKTKKLVNLSMEEK